MVALKYAASNAYGLLKKKQRNIANQDYKYKKRNVSKDNSGSKSSEEIRNLTFGSFETSFDHIDPASHLSIEDQVFVCNTLKNPTFNCGKSLTFFMDRIGGRNNKREVEEYIMQLPVVSFLYESETYFLTFEQFYKTKYLHECIVKEEKTDDDEETDDEELTAQQEKDPSRLREAGSGRPTKMADPLIQVSIKSIQNMSFILGNRYPILILLMNLCMHILYVGTNESFFKTNLFTLYQRFGSISF